ncbi:MAG: hypothetical protein PSV13_17800 [Lacunisphaera sp.]|nr:hypothetical protein [Lacunisphaera sp.]
MTTNPIRVLFVYVAAFTGSLIAQPVIDNTSSGGVTSVKSLHASAESLENLTDDDRQAYIEALDYIRSVVSSLKALSSEEKEKLVVLLCARRSPREIIVVGNLLRVLALNKAADAEFTQRLAKEQPQYRASLAAEASERTAWAFDAVRRYLEAKPSTPIEVKPTSQPNGEDQRAKEK